MLGYDFCARPPARRSAALVFLAVLSLYAATAGGSLATQDASAVYAQTRSLVERGTADVPPEISGPAWRGVDGRYHLPFGIGQALYNIPFYLAGKLAIRLTGVRIGNSDDTVLKASVLLGNAVAGALCASLVFMFSWRLTGRERHSVAAAVLYAVGSLAWTYSKFGFNAMPTAVMLAGGMYGVWSGVKLERVAPVAWGGAALAFAFLTRHEMLLAGIVCVLWTASAARPQCRRRQVGCLIGVLGLAVLGWVWYNTVRFGGPLETGHHPGLGGVGLLGLTLSPAASVFLYAPLAGVGLIVLMRLWRDGHSYARLAGPVLAVLFMFYALLEDWMGTRSYGPRYLVPLLALVYAPLAIVPALGWRTWATRLAFAVAVLSVVVQVPGVLVNFATVGETDGLPSPNREPFAWRSSPLVRNSAALMTAVPANARDLAGTDRPPGSRPVPGEAAATAGELSGRLAFSLDLWWLYLFHLGRLTAPTALGFAAGLLLSAGLLLWAVLRGRAPALWHTGGA
jgi:hypothetical protein